MSLLVWLPVVLFVTWATKRWVPAIINHYGFTHFDWKKPYVPALFFGTLLVAVQLLVVALFAPPETQRAAPLAVVGAALMVVAMQGVVRLDLTFHVIPDRLQVLGLVGAALYVWAHFAEPSMPLVTHVALGLALPLGLWLLTKLYELVRKREALGLGDVKLLVWLGVALGPAVYMALVYAVVSSFVLVVPLTMLRIRRMDDRFAFGPYLVLGAVVHVAVARALSWSPS